jgi:hypothetical protein
MKCKWCNIENCSNCSLLQNNLTDREFEEKIFSLINYQFIKAFNQVITDCKERAKVLNQSAE